MLYRFSLSLSPPLILSVSHHCIPYPFICRPLRAPGSMKGRRAGRRRRAPVAAPMTLSYPAVHPPRLPPLSFRCFPHGQRGHVPVVMETRANRDGNSAVARSLSVLSLSISLFLFSLSSFRSCSLFAYTIRIPFSLSVVSKLSLVPSCFFLLPRWPSLSSSADRPAATLSLPPPSSRAPSLRSPGLVSLTYARRIVMGNVQMH